MDEDVLHATHLSVSVEYRGLKKGQKAAKMCKEDGISERVVMKALKMSKGAIYRAKKAYDQHRVIGQVGRPKLLPSEYEVELVRQIDEAEALKKNLTMEELKSRAKDIYLSIPYVDLAKGLPCFSPHYFERVFEENDLKKKTRIPIEQNRILTAETIDHWMGTLEELIQKYDFPPELIFNFDETALDFTAPKLKVVSRAGKPRPFAETAGKGEHITLGLCISASGSALRPLVILPLKTLPSLSTEVSNFYAISGSDAGFITKELWYELVVHNLVPEIDKTRARMGTPDAWALMIVDGHNSRDLAEGVEYLYEHRIILACMAAHSSAICQPLDLSVNGIFKVNIRNFFKPLEGESVPDKRNRLLYLSIYALQIAFNAYNIKLGFSRAGIHPFSREAPLKSRYIKSPFVPTPPPATTKRVKRRSISGRVLTPENTLRGLPPAPEPKKRVPRLKSGSPRRPALPPPPTTQMGPIGYIVAK